MRVRKLVLVREPKTLDSDTGWRTTDLNHRDAPVFPKTTPIRGGWQWRSAKSSGETGHFVLLSKCNPIRDNWQSILIFLHADGASSAVARFEHHGHHPGLHAHADCGRSGLEAGASSLDDLVRAPKAGRASHHPRTNPLAANDVLGGCKDVLSSSGP